MNKLTKGTIAGAAGIVLLLGGAGTFALWNDSADISGGTVTSGTLYFDPVTAGTWQDVSPDVTGAPKTINPATFLTVPGDVLTYTSTVVVNATGTNLLANFGVAFDGTAVLPQGLSTAVKVNGTPVTGPIKVTNGATYTVVVTLAFDAATAGKVSQNKAVDLGGIDLTLTQVRPVP